MTLNDTPRANRIHIGIFGRRNAGKSSLINALTGQDLAIVSDTPGTTADPVFKSMELHPVGPVVFIDTAGFDDEGELGALRVSRTREVIEQTDLAIMVIDGKELSKRPAASDGAGANEAIPDVTRAASGREDRGFNLEEERVWLERLEEAKIPVITAVSHWDKLDAEGRTAALAAAHTAGCGAARAAIHGGAEEMVPVDSNGHVIPVSAKTGEGMDALRNAIVAAAKEPMQKGLLGNLLDGEGLALLVMPQDLQAPKGRLILPQVQTIRELLDRQCTVVSTTADGLDRTLDALRRPPELIITDSQCFEEVYKKKPEESALTSFSILMAAAKGDIDVFVDGAAAIDRALKRAGEEMTARDRSSAIDAEFPNKVSATFHVLIAEACTHVPLQEDIGTVKIPRLLKRTFGDHVSISHVRGNDFPDAEALKQFDLIIHCGACMFNRRHVMSRIAAAREAGVPITNYGVFLAKMAGILDRIEMPG